MGIISIFQQLHAALKKNGYSNIQVLGYTGALEHNAFIREGNGIVQGMGCKLDGDHFYRRAADCQVRVI